MKAARLRARVACLAATVALASCGGAQEAADPLADVDPSVGRALNDQLLTDPDLTSVNEANAALTRSGDNSLPRDVDNPEAIRAAQDRATELLGGTRSVPDLPAAVALEPEPDESPFVVLEDTAQGVPGASRCMAGTRYGAVWAARLPKIIPIYPRGTLTEAFGSDIGGCRLRAVRFRSPVPAEDIARYYLGRGRSAGYSVIYAANETGWQVSGKKGAAHFLVRSRPSVLEHQEIDLITFGQPDGK